MRRLASPRSAPSRRPERPVSVDRRLSGGADREEKTAPGIPALRSTAPMPAGIVAAAAILAVLLRAAETGPAAVLGDRPGDVERITAAEVQGAPALLPDGRLMMCQAKAAPGGARSKVWAVFSRDHGATWSGPETLFEAEHPGGQFGVGPVLVARSGTVHLFGTDYYGFDFKAREKSRGSLWHARSTDGGRTWSLPRPVDIGSHYTGAANSAFQLRSGRILAPVSGLTGRRIGAFAALVPYSDDDGASWQRPPEQIALDTGRVGWYESGAVEPVGIELQDGRVWLLPRSQDGYQWEAFSSDGGLRWSEPRHTRFVSNQSAMAVLRLRDGRLLLFWNNCEPEGLGDVTWGKAERAVMAAALSADEGRSWIGYREVERATVADQVSYPYAAQAGDGRVVLYLGHSPLSRVVRVDPSFLEHTEFREDFSRGIGTWSTLAAEGALVVADPSGGSGRVLRLAKPRADVPAAACLNFPFGVRGRVALTLRVEPGFQGAQLAFTDHYALPGLPREGSFPVRIEPSGAVRIVASGGAWVDTPGELAPGAWHRLELDWDCEVRRAALRLDGTRVAVIEQFVSAPGLCYLRLRSTARGTDGAGLHVRLVSGSVLP